MQSEARTWNGRAVMHVDMDAFFAAVEQLDHPDWRGLPVIVGGSPDGRGVVSTCSYEARVFGVRSAMPSAQAVRLCPDAIWAWPRMERYVEFSRKIREIFSDETPDVQPVSIDEAFLDVTPAEHGRHPVDIARRIQSRIAGLGLSASIGLGTTKTVAKIASDFEKPRGLTVVWPGKESEFLSPLAVELLSGIGPVAQGKLHKLGIHTLGELAALDDETAEQLFGSHGETLLTRARGLDVSPVSAGQLRKSVSHERTFSEDIHSSEEASSVLRRLSSLVARRLRKHDLAGRTVQVKVRFSDFTTRTIRSTLSAPTNLDDSIFDVAQELLESAWVPGVGVRLLGVGVSGWDEDIEQLDLLAGDEELAADTRPDDERQRRLAASVDEVVSRYGSDSIGYGPKRRIKPATPAYEPPDSRDP